MRDGRDRMKRDNLGWIALACIVLGFPLTFGMFGLIPIVTLVVFLGPILIAGVGFSLPRLRPAAVVVLWVWLGAVVLSLIG